MSETGRGVEPHDVVGAHTAGERLAAAATAPAPGYGHVHRWFGGREPLAVSALFDAADAVDRALDTLYTAGVPRDLIEVVVSREAAARYYAGARTRRPGRETFRYAGIGGLLGFLGGVVLSLLAVAWPGIEAPGGHAIVQLAGPNIGTIVGAGIGAVYGFLRRQQPDRRHARAAEAAAAIVVAVRVRAGREAELVGTLLAGAGGREVRLEEG